MSDRYLFRHYGKTPAGDLVASVSWPHGFYLCLGRLDMSLDLREAFRRRRWKFLRSAQRVTWCWGPLDAMWAGKGREGT